ncbi:HPr family phosphocarrier protein [Treponema lecithinolyticum]|jgi:phosphocarrier,  HPr family|uniref:Phosphocarrier protein HPr n=1 Tax=Treponema lecithinolyticum ATCC 700332 TaxID=1321815 RepID=A0ABN0P159_TRELE|nr:HPr family phosphocarrier protein [Treponema lecithinolyticum]ERJ94250.1 putative phosphocarrier protein HPr [Treponema lecithinolyticum ATCC 700332]
MVLKEITVKNPTGLHTRPANDFVTLANTFQSDISIRKNEKTANAKSIIKLLRVGISQNDTVVLEATGPDEEQAVKALAEFIDQLQE